MAVVDGSGIAAVSNPNVRSHPFWSQITILDAASTGRQFNDLIWINPAVWDMDQPRFTCVPPCNVKIPPWLGATSTVNYPLITVSSGPWTSTITQAPLTISQWVFETVTLTQDTTNKKLKRHGFAPFLPVLATTSLWPSVIYTGANADLECINQGSDNNDSSNNSISYSSCNPSCWKLPQTSLDPQIGFTNEPTVLECSYPFDPLCLPNPYLVNGNGSTIAPGSPDDDDENWEEHLIICPDLTSSTTSTTKATATTTVAQQPTESPLEQGDHTHNTVSCYKKGEKTEHVRMESAASSFCKSISKSILQKKLLRSEEYQFDYNGGFGSVTIRVSLEILKDTCQYVYSEASCLKYLSVPTDSCDCGGINDKHGGTVKNNCYEWRIDPQLRL